MIRPKANEMPSRSAPVMAGFESPGEHQCGDDRPGTDQDQQGGAEYFGEGPLL